MEPRDRIGLRLREEGLTAPEFHLKPDAAKNLINQVLETYRDKHGGPPKELFIHGRTTFRDDEWAAFENAVAKETTRVGVRIRATHGETKLFQNGDYPVLRGTAIVLDEQNAHLWTTGYVPQVDTYIGPETSNPIFVSFLRSSQTMSNLQDDLGDIMDLTKINYDARNFNDGLPVTVRFADKVGDVLSMGSARAPKSSHSSSMYSSRHG